MGFTRRSAYLLVATISCALNPPSAEFQSAYIAAADTDEDPPAAGQPRAPFVEQSDDVDDHPPGPLDAFLGAARRVVGQASRLANGPSSEASIDDLVDAAADAARTGLAAADEVLPPLKPDEAKKFGDTFRDSLLSTRKRIADRRTIDLVNRAWAEILKASKTPAESVTLTLVEAPEINAYAFVGRNIVVNRGFIKFASDCERTHDVIRFALAHELGHIICGHTDTLFRRMVAADKIVSGASLGPAIVEAIIKQTPINQASEREADCFARTLHLENGWSLEGGKEFLARVRAMSDRPESGKAIASLFASHPDENRRLELLESGEGCDR